MAKIYPHQQALSSSSSSSSTTTNNNYVTSKRETFTIWMKSLVYQTNGCTVYNSNGQIVFRVDNYDQKGSNEVHLMDLHGKVLYTIRKKKMQAWDGYRWGDDSNEEKPWFQVKRDCKIMVMGDLDWQIIVGCDKYRIVRLNGKSGFRIVNHDGNIIAEAKQKESSCGVVLGNDVLSLEVEPYKDHSLIVAFVTVYGLICRKM